ncbi:Influenza virus NS1A-binding protein [Madurella mycetomatis]|uniref:Influenza virus NS1A-binding protein n=1 Tax=Madurella mycetomatis TaxID=100816 RepID=A0A175VUF6_9PEZI|nr:Influenza virus NS1A-binding protein [Madurella mycetomatis]
MAERARTWPKVNIVELDWDTVLQTAVFPNPGRGTWQTLAPIADYPRQEHVTLALSETSIGVLCGIVPRGNSTGPFETTDLFQIYDIPTDTWRTAAPAPVPLNHPNAAVLNGTLYLLGGLTDQRTASAWQATPQSYFYDPAADAWTPLPDIPSDTDTPRGSAAMAVDAERGLIYLAGGLTRLPLDTGGTDQETVDDVSVFDVRRRQWGRLPRAARRMPARRDHAGAAVVDGVLYVLGGRDRGQANVRGEVFALGLDPKGLRRGWVTKRGRMPTPRGGVAAAEVDGKVYVFGGEGNPKGVNGMFTEVEVYDTRRDRWEKLADMEVPRHGTSAVSIGGGVYIPGGGIRQSGAPVNVFDVYWP